MYMQSNLNHNVGNWNVTNVRQMEKMFAGNFVFNNADSDSIKNWYTPSLFDNPNDSNIPWAVYGMFSGATRFNQPLTNFCFNNVTNTNYMFENCYEFNQDCSNWERPGASMQTITTAFLMFANCRKFNGGVNTWNIKGLTRPEAMFKNCYAFNKPMDNWNTTGFTSTVGMFQNCVSLNQNLGSWKLSSVRQFGTYYEPFFSLDNTANSLPRTTFDLSPTNLNNTLLGWAPYISRSGEAEYITFPKSADPGTCDGIRAISQFYRGGVLVDGWTVIFYDENRVAFDTRSRC